MKAEVATAGRQFFATMGAIRNSVENHYTCGDILERILRALREINKDICNITSADLARVDEFHVRGREATIELAARAALKPGLRVLDVGSGLGGSVRYLASEHAALVTGLDMTHEYVEASRALAELVGLTGAVDFRQGSALDMPFPDASFDVVWTEHVQMNIADKRAFYAEIVRVLAARGRLVFHDIFQGAGGSPHFPVPWADDAAISFLAAPDTVRDILEATGFEIIDWEDKSRQTLEWFVPVVERLKRSGPLPLGLHLLMGENATAKFENIVRNLREGRISVWQASAEKV